MARVLIIDDEVMVRRTLQRCLEDMGHEAFVAGSLEQGAALASRDMDVIFLDLGLPDGKGQKAIDTLRASSSRPEIIVITGLGDNYGAEEALRRGAWDYIRKPASPMVVRSALFGALEYRAKHKGEQISAKVFDDCGMIAQGAVMRHVLEALAKTADSDANVLILGETGVGKELAARAIHANSARKDGPFVVVDCSNLSETLLESTLYGHTKGSFTGAVSDRGGLVVEADKGTLFLDEVGELPIAMQKSFLRVLQEKRFRPVGASREYRSDFRLLAATNRNLEAMSTEGLFRSDLLFRLRTQEVQLPPLREREGDLERLADYFVSMTCDRYGIAEKRLSKQLLKVFQSYQWPGNIREMRNVIESTIIEAGKDSVVYPKHLPAAVRLSLLVNGEKDRGCVDMHPPRELAEPKPFIIPPYEEYKAICNRKYFKELLLASENDLARASVISGLSIPSIYRHLGLARIPTPRKKRS
ncbi:MAG: sigma-54-dependent Fis family transcriptional regulator [Desulfovibrionales bacterium]|nr:MAG: sigma-54-dependent Fis family transcriptional regulator [Desulfovibrionales bacterium]